ncbi:MAG: tetratricopeptide repeat protein [Cardiobacteriaceae bacterium]|nr:tetratricopeptide repeat protein [Cardiobacteriaceae bacterium]
MRSLPLGIACALVLGGCASGEMQQQIASLQSTNQTLTQRLARLEEEQGALKAQLSQASSVRVPTGISAVPSARRQSGVLPQTTAPAQSGSYEQAYALFQAGDSDGAIAAFEQFLRSGGSGAQADLAQYWLGEAYYNKRNYDFASRYYATYLKAAPHGERSASALQKLVESLKAMGRAEDARILQQQGISAIAN